MDKGAAGNSTNPFFEPREQVNLVSPCIQSAVLAHRTKNLEVDPIDKCVAILVGLEYPNRFGMLPLKLLTLISSNFIVKGLRVLRAHLAMEYNGVGRCLGSL